MLTVVNHQCCLQLGVNANPAPIFYEYCYGDKGMSSSVRVSWKLKLGCVSESMISDVSELRCPWLSDSQVIYPCLPKNPWLVLHQVASKQVIRCG
ncbi:hypothetical protein DVH24_028555 [Malus domestica]|uniref:Uncharacterized protein n=1 Tax=Malus domestica TaxID=3750 RepID=A0A498IXI3_MALDO|nr:hypothetical protein DVH24_028555 [Malus domestica]